MTEELKSPALAINGKEYPIDQLPGDIQNLLNIYSKWETELKAAKVEVFKLEAAIKGITVEIETRVHQFENTPQV